jgi:hypothetical protein
MLRSIAMPSEGWLLYRVINFGFGRGEQPGGSQGVAPRARTLRVWHHVTTQKVNISTRQSHGDDKVAVPYATLFRVSRATILMRLTTPCHVTVEYNALRQATTADFSFLTSGRAQLCDDEC